MVLQIKVTGLIAVTFTPFDDKNEVNLAEIKNYGKYLADRGVNGVLVNGTPGEGTCLTFEERKAVLEEWVNVAKITKLRVIVQIGGTNAKEVKELAAHAENLKVDGLLCLPDIFFKPKSVEVLVEYMKAISESAPKTPLLYYHIPFFTDVYLDMNKFLKIGGEAIPTLAGIEYCHFSLADAVSCVSVHDKKFTVYYGHDQILSAAFIEGFENVMIPALNYAPEMVCKILEHVKSGQNQEAVAIERKLTMLIGMVLNTTTWLSGMKAATSMITGLNLGPVRLPHTTLDNTQLQTLHDKLKAKGWLK
ncbi:hypothetical protein PGB90_003803 [Kerria lacca]